MEKLPYTKPVLRSHEGPLHWGPLPCLDGKHGARILNHDGEWICLVCKFPTGERSRAWRVSPVVEVAG